MFRSETTRRATFRQALLGCALALGVLGMPGRAHAASQIPKGVVLPLAKGEGVSERTSTLFSATLIEEMRNRDDELEVISHQAPAGVVRAVPDEGGRVNPEDAIEALAEGNRLLGELKFAEAVDALKKGIDGFTKNPASAHFEKLLDGYVSLAVAYFRIGEEKKAQGALAQVARLNRGYKLESGRYPPVFVREFEKAVQRAERAMKGSLTVEGPPGANAWVDGKDLGMVPVVQEELVVGTHYVKLEGTRGEVQGQAVEVRAGPNQWKGSLSGSAQTAAGGAVPIEFPRVGSVADAELSGRLFQVCRARGVDFAVVGAIYPTGEKELAVGAAVYSLRRQGFFVLPTVRLDRELVRANVEAMKLVDEIVAKLRSGGATAGLPIVLAGGAGTKFAPVDAPRPAVVSRTDVPTRAPLTPREGSDRSAANGQVVERVRPLGRSSEMEPDVPGEEVVEEAASDGFRPRWWMFVAGGAALVVVAGATIWGISEANRPVTGTVKATW